MNLGDFDFDLPAELIAQAPLAERGGSRLLVIRRDAGSIEHARFADLPDLLTPGDLLVRNETRVIPARLRGRKESGGQVELLLVERREGAEELWRCMTRSSKPTRIGSRLYFPGEIEGEVEADLGDGWRLVRFRCRENLLTVLESAGEMPLPPYIQRPPAADDRERYQTVYAREPGAVAAPTAGLHFSGDTFAELAARGIHACGLTLHVGPGTFLPVRSENLDEHRMHGELFAIPAETAEAVNRAHAEGRRVVAIGTTSTRALESAVDENGALRATSAETHLFIRPGFRFRMTDALITNFHLPKSTLLVLVAAFAGRELILEAYRQAVEKQYRFFSYGDCMLIL
ncbi:MAG: tRNA preQ1(34) S-adenosylmethionine ribosyltransferase-isomerase QueA [Deltaproteobacteria bacterium]|nr:MAG: tRNA preQ1(34) S-adenosylmethionine ribosyltransferase-isomerase QueA [Deltaproteobacteria bacterium]